MQVTSGILTGLVIYALVVFVITLVALFTSGRTKPVIIALVILWVPLGLFTVLPLALGVSLHGTLITAFVAVSPLIAIGATFLLIWRFLNRLRN